MWLKEAMLVILILYDAPEDRSYWLYIQAHFESIADFDLAALSSTMTIHIPLTNLLSEETVRQFARYRDNVMSQINERIRHHV